MRVVFDQPLTRHAAPGRQIERSPRIGCMHPDHLARLHLLQQKSQPDDQIAATEVAGVPFAVMIGFAHRVREGSRALRDPQSVRRPYDRASPYDSPVRMSLVFYSKTDAPEPWREAIRAALPSLPFHVWPQTGDPAAVRYTLVWKPPAGWHGQFPHLRAILSLGAGVDAILADPNLPPDVPVLRLLDAGLSRQMAEYAAYGVLHFHRRMHEYSQLQRNRRWEPLAPTATEDFAVGVMGLGVLGSEAARLIAALGYPVLGWSRAPKRIPAVKCYAADDLDHFLAHTAVLVNFLPLTPATAGILDAHLFAKLPSGACLVNLARGAHVVDADLVAALDSGQIGGALLDVFHDEPLPADHPYWRHPRVIVTPHVAAVTLASEAAAQVIANLRRLERGETPLGIVDRAAGY